MSQIIFNIPECEKVQVADKKSTPDGVVTVTATECVVPNTVPPIIPGYAFFLAFVIVLAGIAGTVFVVQHSQKLKPRRMEEKRLARKQEIDGQVRLAEAQKTCPSCTSTYLPELATG